MHLSNFLILMLFSILYVDGLLVTISIRLALYTTDAWMAVATRLALLLLCSKYHPDTWLPWISTRYFPLIIETSILWTRHGNLTRFSSRLLASAIISCLSRRTTTACQRSVCACNLDTLSTLLTLLSGSIRTGSGFLTVLAYRHALQSHTRITDTAKGSIMLPSYTTLLICRHMQRSSVWLYWRLDMSVSTSSMLNSKTSRLG